MKAEILKHTWPEPLPPWTEPVDLAFADPPYNIKVKYQDDYTRDNLSPERYRDLCWETVNAIVRSLKPGGTLWWLTSAEHGATMWQIVEDAGLSLLYNAPVVWHERFSQYQKKRLTRDYRLLFPMVKPGGEATFNPDAVREKSVRQEMGDKRADPRGRVPGHVWQVRRLQGTASDRVNWHTAQLPPEPLWRIVEGWTDPGDLVLDAFAGSGNMGLACRDLGRRFIGTDQSEFYCKKIRHRLAFTPRKWKCCACRKVLSLKGTPPFAQTGLGAYCEVCFDSLEEKE